MEGAPAPPGGVEDKDFAKAFLGSVKWKHGKGTKGTMGTPADIEAFVALRKKSHHSEDNFVPARGDDATRIRENTKKLWKTFKGKGKLSAMQKDSWSAITKPHLTHAFLTSWAPRLEQIWTTVMMEVRAFTPKQLTHEGSGIAGKEQSEQSEQYSREQAEQYSFLSGDEDNKVATT